MPSDWKIRIAPVLLCALILIGAYYASRPAPRPQTQTVEIDPEMDLDIVLRRSLSVEGTTSSDLFRIRQTNLENILPPTDFEQARVLLSECETLWNELQAFKDDPALRLQSFSPDSRFAQWRERAEYLHDNRPSKAFVGSDIHRLTDRMLGVANDYAGTIDYPSSQEEWFVNYFLPMAKKSLGSPESVTQP